MNYLLINTFWLSDQGWNSMDKNFRHVGNDLLQDPIPDKISGYRVLTNQWLIVGTIKKPALR
jgi:hypothetical protein